MAFKNNCVATLWKVDKENGKVVDIHEKYADISISTSKQNRDTAKYETDFAGKVRLLGQAFDKIKQINLTEKDKIKLINVEVNNKYDASKRVTYTNYICWDIEVFDHKDKRPKPVEVVESDNAFDINSDDLPF